jgi:hypothetical protein
VGREIEHEQVVDRLIDLQAQLRGEPDPPIVSVARDDVEVAVTPPEMERVWVEPTPEEQERPAPPERLASILGRVDGLRGELTQVVEALDATTEELAPPRAEPGRDDGPRDRLRQHI